MRLVSYISWIQSGAEREFDNALIAFGLLAVRQSEHKPDFSVNTECCKCIPDTWLLCAPNKFPFAGIMLHTSQRVPVQK